MAKRRNGEDAEVEAQSTDEGEVEDLTAGHPAGEYPTEGTFGYGTEPTEPQTESQSTQPSTESQSRRESERQREPEAEVE
jgi:hypothetical protein